LELFLQQALNFINVLQAHFLYEILVPKISMSNVTREKLPKSCQKAAKKLPKRR
jgi:hypothetical protein